MTTQTQTRFRLNNVRCDWPNLFKGEQYQGKGNFRCGAALILGKDHPQFKDVEAAIVEAATVKWKKDAQTNLKIAKAKDNICMRDGDIKAAKSDGYADMFYISANCKGGETEAECDKPKVYAADRSVVETQAKSPIYRGCYVNAVVEFYADDRFDTGVFAKLVGIQFAKDGDAFGSAPARADDFEDVSAGAESGLF